MQSLGIDTHLLAVLAAFLVSLLSSTAGVTGAFLLVPFQVSVLGLGSPSVSATNHFYNVVAAPGGFSGYRRQRRMLWPVAVVLVAGTVPGILLGIALRVKYLPADSAFRPFAGIVLGLLGLLLLVRALGSRRRNVQEGNASAALAVIETGWNRIRYRFGSETHSVAVPPLCLFSLLIGTVGGAYGVGGGVFTSAYLIGVCGSPVYATAGATLLATFVASCVGALGFAVVGWSGAGAEVAVSPLWSLGLAMGIGGLAGGYLGARVQRFLPSPLITLLLAAFVLLLGSFYIVRSL
jgi:uncharacterized membrane protein YfcA